eukprot:scaffold10490_cov129-Cylindrotheca_fusiformis.AAC.9
MSLTEEASKPIQITDTECDFEGRTIREYSVDSVSGNLVVRIGADLYLMEKNDIESKLSSGRRQLEQTGEDLLDAQNATDTSTTEALSASNSTSIPSSQDDGTANTTRSEPIEASDSTVSATTDTPSTDSSVPDEEDLPTSQIPKDSVSYVPSSSPTNAAATTTADPDETVDDSNEDQNTEEVDSVESHTNTTTATNSESTTGDESVNKEDNAADNSASESATSTPTAASDGSRSENDIGTPNATISTNATEEDGVSKVYYQYNSPLMDSRKEADYEDHYTGTSAELKRIPVVVHSDFSSHQERLIPVNMDTHKTSMDIYRTALGTTQAIMTLRGQLWVAPVVDKTDTTLYKGGGMNMPSRRYRVAPGAMMGGMVRILAVRHVPNPVEDTDSDRRLAVILATDPLTDTAEHAFYLIETQAGVIPTFLDSDHLPKPFLGGHVGGGRTLDGGLGSVKPDTIALSPCGRRMSWSDTDGRIMAMNMPQYQDMNEREQAQCEILPKENELGEPMVGDEVDLRFSPGGRYLAVEHNARNQFRVISIVDLGIPEGDNMVADISIGRIVQATPSRFNSVGAYWGKSGKDVMLYQRDDTFSQMLGTPPPNDVSTALYFLSDRDIQTDVTSPWGTRQPMPHFKANYAVFALPLSSLADDGGHFSGGGASEVFVDEELERHGMIQSLLSVSRGRKLGKATKHSLSGVFGVAEKSFRRTRNERRRLEESMETNLEATKSNETETIRSVELPSDLDIDFGPRDLTFARNAYRVANIPEGKFVDIVCQTPDASALVLIEAVDDTYVVTVCAADPFPSDTFEVLRLTLQGRQLQHFALSSSRDYFYLGFGPDGEHVVVSNTFEGISDLFADESLETNVVDTNGMHLSVWPALEYRQLYDDAWR